MANNGLIVSGSDGLRLMCVSNSSQSGVGMITLPNGMNVNTNNLTFGVWKISNPFHRPGVLRFQTDFRSSLNFTASDQGIYTCTIPDNNGNQFIFNVGLYPYRFTGELWSVCAMFVLFFHDV